MINAIYFGCTARGSSGYQYIIKNLPIYIWTFYDICNNVLMLSIQYRIMICKHTLDVNFIYCSAIFIQFVFKSCVYIIVYYLYSICIRMSVYTFLCYIYTICIRILNRQIFLCNIFVQFVEESQPIFFLAKITLSLYV